MPAPSAPLKSPATAAEAWRAPPSIPCVGAPRSVRGPSARPAPLSSCVLPNACESRPCGMSWGPMPTRCSASGSPMRGGGRSAPRADAIADNCRWEWAPQTTGRWRVAQRRSARLCEGTRCGARKVGGFTRTHSRGQEASAALCCPGIMKAAEALVRGDSTSMPPLDPKPDRKATRVGRAGMDTQGWG
jgi:hypothetical protein